MTDDLVSIRVSGMEDLASALADLPARIAKNALRGGVRAAAVVFKDEAVALAPEWTGDVSEGHPPPGTLKRSIYVRYDKEHSNKTFIRYVVKCRTGQKGEAKANSRKDAYYWRWVEFGHMWVPKGHAGFTRRSKASGISDLSSGAKWIPASPFMRPAFESKKSEATRAFIDYMSTRVAQEMIIQGAKNR